MKRRSVAAALVVLLLAACGGGDDGDVEPPGATDRSSDSPASGSGEVPDAELSAEFDMAAVCDGLDVAAAGDVIGVELRRVETDPGRCAWSGREEMVVFAVNPGLRDTAMQDFPLTGTMVDEPEVLGLPAITRDDGGGRYAVAVFADQWYVSVAAVRTPDVLEDALAAAVAPVAGTA